MKNKIIAIITLLVILAACLYAYEFVFKKPLVESPTENGMQDDLFMPTVAVKEQSKDGVYTVVGELQLPTPCHTLETSVSPSNSSTYRIDVTTIAPKEGVMCAQVVTPREFRATTTVATGETPNFTLFVDGIEYRLDRFEVPEGMDIDDFQLELKG